MAEAHQQAIKDLETKLDRQALGGALDSDCVLIVFD